MNWNKTELYTSGLNEAETLVVTRFGFNSGSLPIRYLGLPLMSRKLRISYYDPLLYKLINCFKSWAVKTLSFAGRLLLLNIVISGTIIFWITTFLLPKTYLKKIDSLFSRFLWTCNIDKFRSAKIAWSTWCLPKSEGGLGLRSFADWNKVLLLHFIWFWLLFSGSKSLWVAWHSHYHLQDKNFWHYQKHTISLGHGNNY